MTKFKNHSYKIASYILFFSYGFSLIYGFYDNGRFLYYKDWSTVQVIKSVAIILIYLVIFFLIRMGYNWTKYLVLIILIRFIYSTIIFSMQKNNPPWIYNNTFENIVGLIELLGFVIAAIILFSIPKNHKQPQKG